MVPKARSMAGSILISLFFTLVPLFLLGMGGIGPDIPTHIPKPQEHLTVAVIDIKGERTELTQFSLDATTFLSGRMGAGTISIPFRLLQKVIITQKDGTYIARAVTNQGREIELEVKGSSRILGKVDIGNFSINLKEVRRLEILR